MTACTRNCRLLFGVKNNFHRVDCAAFERCDAAKWKEMAPYTAKGAPMPKTIQYYEQLTARDLELIMEQKKEISKLKNTVNQLRQGMK